MQTKEVLRNTQLSKLKMKGKRRNTYLKLGDEIVVRYRLHGTYLTFYGILFKMHNKNNKNFTLFLKRSYTKINTYVYFRLLANVNSTSRACIEILNSSNQKLLKFKHTK